MEESSNAKNTPLIFFRFGNSFTYVICCRSHWRHAVHQQVHLHLLYFWCRSLHPHKKFCRSTEKPRLEGMSKDCLVQLFVGKEALMSLSSTLPNCKKNPFSYGDSTMFLGRVFQWMIDLTVKKFLSYIEMKTLIKPLPRVPNKQP